MSKWLNDPKKFGVLSIIPLELLLNILIMIPFIIGIYISTTKWSPVLGDWWDTTLFVGYQNYLALFQDIDFLSAIGRTVIIVSAAVALEFCIGLILALLFYGEIRGSRVLSSLAILPMTVIPIVSGYTFYLLFLGKGPINQILSTIMGQEVAIIWLGKPATALLCIILTDVWQWTPFVFLVLFSGFQALPTDPINAARVLGASRFRVFKDIMLPMLKPIIFVALLLRGIEAVRIFDPIFILTGGGPGRSTQTISFFLYEEGLKFMKLGYAAAGSIIILLTLAIFSWRLTKLIRR